MKLNTLIDEWIGEEKVIQCNPTHLRVGITDPHMSICWSCSSEHGKNELRQDLKSRKQELVDGIVGKVIELTFKMNIDEYLPKVKRWNKTYDEAFDDGYSQAKKDLLKELTGE